MRTLVWLALLGCTGAPGTIDPNAGADTQAQGGVCVPGDSVCNASYLLKCRADGAGYLEIFCEKGCLSGSCVSTACVDGSRRCQGGKLLETCADGLWATTLCDQGCVDGACVPLSCVAGQAFCEVGGSKRVQCSPSGLELTVLEVCEHGCDAAAATCRPAACAAGERRCAAVGGQPERCNAERSAFEATGEVCEERCEAGSCVVSACPAGKKRCGQDGVETCNAAGSAYVKTQACTYGCLAGPSGQATCASCFPGATRCAGQEIQFCASPFAPWQTVQTCNTIDSCAGGQCVNVLKLSGPSSQDSVRLLLMEGLADCWVELQTTSPQQTGDQHICRGLDTTEQQGDIAQSDLRTWFCDASGEGLTADDFKDEAHYAAAKDVMGCGTLDFEDLTIDTLNHKVHGGLYAVECVAFDRKSAEILVAPCEELKNK